MSIEMVTLIGALLFGGVVRNITGSWWNPSGGVVLFLHDPPTKSLQMRWVFNSYATGPVTLIGQGTVTALDLRNLELTANIQPISLILDGRLCETSRIDFSSKARWTQRDVIMKQCSLVFSFHCGKGAPGTITTDCSGRWE